VPAPVNTGEPDFGIGFGLSRLNGSASNTSVFAVYVLPPLFANHVGISVWNAASVDAKLAVTEPDIILFFTYITPDCASVTVFAPSTSIPVGYPIIIALFILFCDDLLKCIPLLKSELYDELVVAAGPTRVTFHHVGDVLGSLVEPEPSLSDSNPFDPDTTSATCGSLTATRN